LVEATITELWKLFPNYGSVGEVFILLKVDKWGKRLCFIKFKDVKDEGAGEQITGCVVGED